MGSLLSLLDFAKGSACFLFVCQQFVPPAAPAMPGLRARLSLSECQLPEPGPSWPGRGAGTPQDCLFAFLELSLWCWAPCITHLTCLDSTSPHPRWANSAGAAKAQPQGSSGAPLSGSTKTAPGSRAELFLSILGQVGRPQQGWGDCRQRLHWGVQFPRGGHSHRVTCADLRTGQCPGHAATHTPGRGSKMKINSEHKGWG